MTEDNKKRKYKKSYTPQQIDFALRYYLPSSPTFGNAKASAIGAGYSESYANTITANRCGMDWIDGVVSEIIGPAIEKRNLVDKARRVLDRSLDSNDSRLAQDTAKFIAKTTAEFSEKKDITSDGQVIAPVALVEFADGDTAS